MEFVPRFLQAPSSNFFLFGPRGTGKSSWLRRAFPEALRVDFLDEETWRTYQARPEHLAEVVRASPLDATIIVDEVQRVPAVLSTVHLLIEEAPTRRFILTGSSARKLKRSGVNLLGGRAVLRTAHPFVAAELGESFRLDEALQFGLVPLVVGSGAPAEVLRGYVALYLREEVQTEGLVRNLGGFARFLEAVAFSHGGVLNVANVARECQVERKVVEGYLGVLEDLLLAWLVPVFSRQARRVLSSHPKFFLFDAGVYRSLRRTGPLDRPGDVEGPALEGLVAQHLRAWCAYRGGDDTLSFWRTASGNEVDFVVYGPLTFCAIEVKNTTRVRPEDLRGLRAFREDYPTSTQILLYRGTESLDLDGIRCLPCERFLRALRPDTELAVDPVLHQAE
jgi:predicted AAA+ superfamily ATPase